MTPRMPDHGFFVGYFKKVPPAIVRFMVLFSLCFLGGLSLAAIVLPVSASSPGSGSYVDELQGGYLTGILETAPYPLLRVAATDGRPARAIMIAGQGKTGLQREAEPLVGQSVDAGGIFVKRGDLDMLLIGGPVGLRAAAGEVANTSAPAPPQPLGRWRLTGEICDGKCYGGSMRPGRGLAHKACANLCIIGGIPPVFVTTAPVEGHGFLLMAGPDGGPLPQAWLDMTATRITLEGTIERRDDILILRVSTAKPGDNPS